MEIPESVLEKSRGREVRPVIGRRGYWVTDEGVIISTKRCKTRIKVQSYRGGYPIVYFGDREKELVHRIVLKAFVGECPIGMECRHLDGDSTNCKLSNLVWGSPSENVRDKVRHGTHNTVKLKIEDVYKIRQLLSCGESCASIARKFGVSAVSIGNIKNGKCWSWLK